VLEHKKSYGRCLLAHYQTLCREKNCSGFSKLVTIRIVLQGTSLGMGHGLISLCKGGTWGFLLMFGYGKKWFNFKGPQICGGNECLVIGNWTEE